MEHSACCYFVMSLTIYDVFFLFFFVLYVKILKLLSRRMYMKKYWSYEEPCRSWNFSVEISHCFEARSFIFYDVAAFPLVHKCFCISEPFILQQKHFTIQFIFPSELEKSLLYISRHVQKAPKLEWA